MDGTESYEPIHSEDAQSVSFCFLNTRSNRSLLTPGFPISTPNPTSSRGPPHQVPIDIGRRQPTLQLPSLASGVQNP